MTLTTAARFPQHRISTCVVLENAEGQVLLVHLNYGSRQWTLPAGVLDHDEDLESSALREVREETGLKAALDGITGLYHVIAKRQLLVAFRGVVEGGKLKKQTGETSDAIWWFPDTLPDNLRAVHRHVIRDALKHKKQAKFRAI